MNAPVLNTIDNPFRFFYWKFSTIALTISILTIGVALDSVLIMAMFLPVLIGVHFVRSRYPKGSFKAFLYWELPSSYLEKSGALVPSHKRKFISCN